MILTRKHDTLKVDKHPFEGMARITIHSWVCYDDGDEDESWGQVSAVYILSHEDCIKLRDELNKRINLNTTTQ